METISVKAPSGIPAETKAFVVGAIKRETKNSTEDNPKFWYGLEVAPAPDADSVLFFCEREHAETAAAAIRDQQAAVEAVVGFVVGKGGVNVTSIVV
jgi:hypothetical protein